MNRRFARYLSVTVPAVAAATVLGAGVSFAAVGHVSPGPRAVASAPTNGRPAGGTDTSGPGAAKPHVTHPAAHLTCHENEGNHADAGGGPNPAVKPGTPAAPSARPATPGPRTAPAPKTDTTSGTDTVTCHWSHVRRHLKAATFELMRSSGGPGGPGPSGSGPSATSPTALKTFDAKAGSFTDTTVAEGQSYTYVLDVMGADGSLLGTSNTVQVRDDDGGKVRLECADHDAPAATGTEKEAVTCHWNRSASDDFASYRLLRDGSPVFTSTKRDKTHFNDTATTEGTTYQYVVDVLDGSGNVIATSNTATVGPDGTTGAAAHAKHSRPGGAGPNGATPNGTTRPTPPPPTKPGDHPATTHRPDSQGTAPAGDHGHGRNGHSGTAPGGTGSQPAGTSPGPEGHGS